MSYLWLRAEQPKGEDCTLATCTLDEAHLTYLPSYGGNIAYAVIFGLIIIPQIVLGIRYKTWGFMVGMVGGLALEVGGYAGRVVMHSDPFGPLPFLGQLIGLTIAPAFLTAALYLCLSRIIVVYNHRISRLRPRTYTYVFVSCDVVSLILQAVGGALAASAEDGDYALLQSGVNIIIAGLAFQVASLLVYMGMCLEYGFKVRNTRNRLNEEFADLHDSPKFKAFLVALATATFLIFIRCVFRVAELSGGFSGPLANNEITFMIFEGPMIFLAAIGLSVFHPGACFNGRWPDAQPSNKRLSGGDKIPLRAGEESA